MKGPFGRSVGGCKPVEFKQNEPSRLGNLREGILLPFSNGVFVTLGHNTLFDGDGEGGESNFLRGACTELHEWISISDVMILHYPGFTDS